MGGDPVTEAEARMIHSMAQVVLVQTELAPEIAFVTADGLEIKQLYFSAPGLFMGQHAHQFSHAHLVGSGAIRVWADGRELGDFNAGDSINIEAGVLHTLMSLKADTRGFCIHNAENPVLKEAVFA